MTDRPPLSPLRTLSRRKRYALAVLPLLLAQPLAGLAQDAKPGGEGSGAPATRGLRQGSPAAVDEPTGIQNVPPPAQPVTPALPVQPAQVVPDPSPPQAQPQQAQPVAPMPPPQADPQAAAPGGPAADPQQLSDQDPPPRVGRLARLNGQVSYRGPGAQDWTPARMNFSVSSGTAIFTQPNARAAIEVNASRFAFDPNTDFQIQQLTEQGLAATMPQGTAFFRMSGMLQGETAAIVTPRGTFIIQADGRYLVESGSAQQPTRFTVLEGTAQAQGEGYETPVPAGQTLVLVGDGAPNGSWVPARPNALVSWAATLEGKGPMPASVRQMTGAEVLTQYGRWDRSGEYGDIWYPRVEPGWAPYRNGQWVWRDPWGWTWVDDAPWGYAPSHYGRWVQTGGRWGWLPQVVTSYDPGYVAPPRPFWAPALVTFLPGVALAGLAAPVSWVPLGPYEPFLPWWRASPRYVNYVNLGYVRNVTVVNNFWVTNVWRGPAFAPGMVRPVMPGMGPFVNIRHATVVPGSVLTGGLRVAPMARPLPPNFVANPGAFTPHFGGPIVRPIAQTPGLTPIGASRLGLPAVAPTTRVPGPPIVNHTNLIGRPGVPTTIGAAGQRVMPGTGAMPGSPGFQPPPNIGRPGSGPTPGGPGTHLMPPRQGGQVGPVGGVTLPPQGASQFPGATGPQGRPVGPGIGVPPPPGTGRTTPASGITPPPGGGFTGHQRPGGLPPAQHRPPQGVGQTPGLGGPPQFGPSGPGGVAGPRPGVGQLPPTAGQRITPTNPIAPPGGGAPGARTGGGQFPVNPGGPHVSPGGRPPGFGAPPGGFQPPPGGRTPGYGAPPGGFQPPPGGRSSGYGAPPGGFQPPPSARTMNPPGGGSGFGGGSPPRMTHTPPPTHSAPPRPTMSAPVSAPPRPAAPPPRPTPPPPRNPNQR